MYNVDELKILAKHFDFDIVTIPFNILDKRFEKSNIVKKLKINRGRKLNVSVVL